MEIDKEDEQEFRDKGVNRVRLRTLEGTNLAGKTVLLRVDINSPVKNGKVVYNKRFEAAASTVRQLSKEGAKLVVLSHQGRKGKKDFISLKQHASILSKLLKKRVKFVPDVVGKKAKKAIAGLRKREVLLLDNVRFLDDETQNKSPEEHVNSTIVKELAPLADVYVNDAFSVSHRSHASVVGFSKVLPSFAGPNLVREVSSLTKLLKKLKISKFDVFVLGGAKPEDPLEIMKSMIRGKALVERFLVGGVLGELFLMAAGYDLGRATKTFLKNQGYLDFMPEVEKIYKRYEKRIVLPVDLACEVNGKRKEYLVESFPRNKVAMDIGVETIAVFAPYIFYANNVVMKGPLGVFEEENFSLGTKLTLSLIANSSAYTLIGGGHTTTALETFGICFDCFSHVSLGGGALIRFLTGKTLPGLEVLKK